MHQDRQGLPGLAKKQACAAGHGIFQSLAMGLDPWLQRGDLVPILLEWSTELYPLYAYLPSRHLPPVKVRVFLDFIVETAAAPALCTQGDGEQR